MHFQNIHTFKYQKILPHTLLSLVFEIVESLQCILKLDYVAKDLLPVNFASSTLENTGT